MANVNNSCISCERVGFCHHRQTSPPSGFRGYPHSCGSALRLRPNHSHEPVFIVINNYILASVKDYIEVFVTIVKTVCHKKPDSGDV